MITRTDSVTSISGRKFLAPTPSDTNLRGEKYTRHESKTRKPRPAGKSFFHVFHFIDYFKVKTIAQ